MVFVSKVRPEYANVMMAILALIALNDYVQQVLHGLISHQPIILHIMPILNVQIWVIAIEPQDAVSAALGSQARHAIVCHALIITTKHAWSLCLDDCAAIVQYVVVMDNVCRYALHQLIIST
jgi:hypothetical protein